MVIECLSDFHNNFVVQHGERKYYHNIPQYIQVGEHQFVENRVVKTWINSLLIGWYVSQPEGGFLGLSYIIGFLRRIQQSCMTCHSPTTIFKKASGDLYPASRLSMCGMPSQYMRSSMRSGDNTNSSRCRIQATRWIGLPRQWRRGTVASYYMDSLTLSHMPAISAFGSI